VAEQDDEILGFGEVYLRGDQLSGTRVARRYAHLQSMFVCSERRNQGIGSSLLAACESWARSMGAGEMRLDIWEFSAGPLGFYERSGYHTIRRSLTRELG
jgi:GNAT superfamily N-acetyltransferase